MMKKIKDLFYLILGLVLLGGGAYATYLLLGLMFNAVRQLSPTIQSSLATGIFLLVVATVSYFANKSLEIKKSTELAMRPKKLDLYEGFIKFFLKVLGNEQVVKKPSEKEIIKFFVASTPTITTYASNSVIKKWGKLRVSMAKNADEKSLFELEELLVEIRKDLGLSSRGLSKGDVLRLFINDIDDHLKK